MRRDHRGFTLIELMISTVIMAIISIGIAQFAAVTFREQRRHAGDTQSAVHAISAVPILERDIMYGGFGMPAGASAFQVRTGVTNPTSVELTILGTPVSGPRKTPWTYVLKSATAQDVIEVRCHGRVLAGTPMPDPITDVVVGGNPVPVQLFNYVGQSPGGLPASLTVQGNSSPCGALGSDFDGDGQPDRQMTLKLSHPISVAAGTLIVPLHSFAAAATTAVRYFVWGDRLWRQVGAEVAAPLLQDVEAFQVQFGWSATDGTFAPGNWAASPPWQADLRQRAVRYQLVMVRRGFESTTGANFDGIAFDYAVPADRRELVRSEVRRTVYSNNALFAHP